MLNSINSTKLTASQLKLVAQSTTGYKHYKHYTQCLKKWKITLQEDNMHKIHNLSIAYIKQLQDITESNTSA